MNLLEESTLSTDLAQGYALKTLTDIFATFVSMDRIKVIYKSRLVSTVLHGYLSLRRLVVQRTKLIDQTQEKLLELLEDMTTGACLLLSRKNSETSLIDYCLTIF